MKVPRRSGPIFFATHSHREFFANGVAIKSDDILVFEI